MVTVFDKVIIFVAQAIDIKFTLIVIHGDSCLYGNYKVILY